MTLSSLTQDSPLVRYRAQDENYSRKDHIMTTWSWRVLQAGAFKLDGGAMFGVVPKALWNRMVDSDDANRIPMQTNCVLLERKDGYKVLIEAGYGNKFGAKDRKIFSLESRWIGDALAEIGVEREEINSVVVSHLHFDHAGGLTYIDGDETPRPSFPNASIYTQRIEWDDALANKSTMTKTYLVDHLKPIQDQVVFLHGEAEIFPGLRVKPVPGHTWGQQAILFDDEIGTICFPGDVLPTINHVGSAFNMAYDMLPYQNMLTKQALLAEAMQENWRLVLDHEPGQPLVFVGRNEGGRYTLHDAKQEESATS